MNNYIQSVICSCILELREALTLSSAFIGFLRIFEKRSCEGGWQHPVLRVNEKKQENPVSLYVCMCRQLRAQYGLMILC
jgi:hypothetical protein